jgi:predicted permease
VALSLALSYTLFRWLLVDPRDRRAAIAAASFGNSGYIPLTLTEIIPTTLPLIGERLGLRIPHLYIGAFLLVFSPLLWSVGNILVAGGHRRPPLRELVSPPLIGILAGVVVVATGAKPLLLDVSLPLFHLYKALERVSSLALPLVMFFLGSMIGGLTFRRIQRKRLISMFLAVGLFRFLILPLLFFGAHFLFLHRIDLSPAQRWILFLEAHLPPASSLAVMAGEENEVSVSFALFLTYLLYLLLLPLYLLLFLEFLSP